MKAVRLVGVGRPLELQEVPDPHFSDGDLVVRVEAAGICRSDAHYRSGVSPTGPLPLTPGHEVAGVIEDMGSSVTHYRRGDRVCLHYLITCGTCGHCLMGREQFCLEGQMIGKHQDGGYAELIRIPAVNAVVLPQAVPPSQAAVIMCSSATSFHAFRKARLQAGDTAVIFGLGGLGMSAIQLARIMGAGLIVGVDLREDRREMAEEYGAVFLKAGDGDLSEGIQELSGGAGADVAVDFTGSPEILEHAARSLAAFGRLAVVAITDKRFPVNTYRDLIGREASIVGVSDHLFSELPILVEYAAKGLLDLSRVVSHSVPLEAKAVNSVLDELDANQATVRTVIEPMA